MANFSGLPPSSFDSDTVPGHTFAILLILTDEGVGGGGVSGLGAISSSGATSAFNANILSKSICQTEAGLESELHNFLVKALR